MKRAWNIFRGNNPYSYSFSAALRRAWEVEKSTVAYNARKAEEAANMARIETLQASRINETANYAFMAGCAKYYSNARPGQYMGD